jgi:hypothetical protein
MPAPTPEEARRTLRPSEAEALAAWRALPPAATEQEDVYRHAPIPASASRTSRPISSIRRLNVLITFAFCPSTLVFSAGSAKVNRGHCPSGC